MSVSPSRQSAGVFQRLRLPPLWLLAVSLAAGGAVVAWEVASAGGPRGPASVLHFLIWPGAAVFLAVYLFAWLGWALDID